MQKTWLIIKREYLTRVRKRTFIIGTLLFPILYLALIFGTGYIAEKSRKNLRVALIDSSGYFTESMVKRENDLDKSSTIVLLKTPVRTDSFDFENTGFDAFIVVPPMRWQTGAGNLLLKAKKTYGEGVTEPIQTKMNRIWDAIKNDSLRIDPDDQQILSASRLGLTAQNIRDLRADPKTASGLGYACGFLIYIIILIYGSQVMMGVMEEKTNRIAEIIVSSVKPFQMMLGKVIGIGMVALTQFFLWIVFVLIVYNITRLSGGGGVGSANQLVGSVQQVFTSVNIPLVLFCFAFYFLGGFFFYASIYGAIGSAINEDVREAQSLSFPVTMLVIISIFLMMSAINDPSGPLAVWASIIPFSSPIVMMARIPFGVPGVVPVWQLALSMILLMGGFVFTTWFAGKIYRTGILMYGKKPSWKEMIKWALRS
jgi:ABC-2 type transport system permease protein